MISFITAWTLQQWEVGVSLRDEYKQEGCKHGLAL